MPVLTLLLLGAACGDKGEGGDEGGGGVADLDGDGFDQTTDCNDADAAVYPGATEVWYDGVDQDCGGENDNDQDQDGFEGNAAGGADCDDTNSAVNPAAVEVWYDGVDQDCRGDDDDDQDQDGFQASVSGGNDCDDTDPDVWPGAPDDWYDGTDQDCDGHSDYDQDGDGYDAAAELATGLDCDDLDEDVHPGALDVWYDGQDTDCGGDDDYDQDGDGYASALYTGDDCDDEDAEAAPGAREQIDGHDTNCDGVGDRFGIEEDYSGGFVQGGELGGMVGGSLAVGDLDEDGMADLVFTQPLDDGLSAAGDGMVWGLLGSTLSVGPTTTGSADLRLLSEATTGPLGPLAFLGDLNGDGAPELAIGGESALVGADAVGKVWIFLANELLLSGERDVGDAGRVLAGGEAGGLFGATVAAIPDLDGDGVDELAVAATGASESAGAVYLFLGDDLGGAGSFDVDLAAATWTGAGADLAGSAIVGADSDGDGRGDLFIGAPGVNTNTGAVYRIGGTSSPTSGTLVARASGTLTGAASNDRAGSTLTTGDLDGDGVPDLVVGAPTQVTQAGRVHVVSGVDLSSGGQALASTAYVNYTGTTVFGNAGTALSAAGDVDGDGRDDLLIGGPGDSGGGAEAGAAWLVISGRSGSKALADADATFLGSPGDAAGGAVGLGDIDGDGRADLLMGDPGEDNFGDEGAVYVGYSGY
jgi:hypothetical protein